MKKHICSLKPEPIDEDQKVVIDLSLGRREPQNDYERKLLEQIKEIHARGGMISLEFE